MITYRIRLLVLLASAAALVASSCSAAEGGDDIELSVWELIRDSNEGFDRAEPIYQTVAEAMPNRLFSIDGAEPHAVADLFVAGPVVRVEEGVGLNWTVDEETNTEYRHVLPFNDPSATVNTVHVTVKADRVITDGLVPAPHEEVTFGLSFPGRFKLESLREELLAEPALAVLLYEPSPFDYEPGLWGVLEDGGLVGTVDADGLVTFPARTVGLPGDTHGDEPEQDSQLPHAEPLADLERTPDGGPISVSSNSEGGWTRD